jgi:hypothetical protein
MPTVSQRNPLPILPTDIIHVIVDVLSFDFDFENTDSRLRDKRRKRREYYSKELLNLRVACRQFCHIVSPRIFRTLRLTHTLKSINGFLAIVESPWANQCVQSVKYQYWDPGKYRHPPHFPFNLNLVSLASEPHRYESVSPDDKAARESRVEIRRLLRHALSRLDELPSLRFLSIRFGDICPEENELKSILDDLSFILDALVSLGNSLPHPLESLSLTRLPPYPLPQYSDPGFRALRANLSLFEIYCASTDAWSALITSPLPPGLISPCEPFFFDTLPLQLVPPPSVATGFENLEALALCFSDAVGIFYLRYSFSKLYFPRLRALRLQHVQFSETCDAERFIVQHGATLLELHLAHCQIAVKQNTGDENGDEFLDWPTVPRPWAAIYAMLMDALGRLVFLDVHDAWWVSFPDQYITYTPGSVMQFLEEGHYDDARRLEEFQRVVKGRAECLETEYEREYFLK